jgi:hypothetical protein
MPRKDIDFIGPIAISSYMPMEPPLPLICPVCSAVFVISDYVPDGATLYKRCKVCRLGLRITPEIVEIHDEGLLDYGGAGRI